MSFLKDSIWRADNANIPNLYDEEENLNFSSEAAPEKQPSNKSPANLSVAVLPTEVAPASPPEPEQQNLPILKEQSIEVVDEKVLPEALPKPLLKNLTPPTIKFTVARDKTNNVAIPLPRRNVNNIGGTIAENIINQINSDKELINELSKKIEDYVAAELEAPDREDQHQTDQDAAGGEDFSQFFGAAKKTKTPTASIPQRADDSKNAKRGSHVSATKINDFFRIDDLSSGVEKLMDLVVGVPDLSQGQANILEIISLAVKFAIRNMDLVLELELDESEAFVLTKNISLILFILYGEFLMDYLRPPEGGLMKGSNEAKAKAIALLTVPVIFKIIVKKLKKKMNRKPPTPPPTASSTSKRISVHSKRKSTTPFQEDFDDASELAEEPQHHIFHPVFKVPTAPAKSIRLESRPQNAFRLPNPTW